MRDGKSDGSSRSDKPAVPVGDLAEQARAAARWILRRAGIAPLLAVGLLVSPASIDPAAAQASPRVTASGEARVRIVTRAIRVGPTGLVSPRSGDDAQARPLSAPRLRPCDPAPASAAKPEPCRMIVYDMP